MELSILHEERGAAIKIAALDFQRANFSLFRHFFGQISLECVIREEVSKTDGQYFLEGGVGLKSGAS